MEFSCNICKLSAREAKALAAFASKDKIRGFSRVYFNFSRGTAVATDGHKMLILIGRMGDPPPNGPEDCHAERLVAAKTLILAAKRHAEVMIEALPCASNWSIASVIGGAGSSETRWQEEHANDLPDYSLPMRRAALDQSARLGKLSVSASHLAEVSEILGTLCYATSESKNRSDGVEIRMPNDPFNPIRFDCQGKGIGGTNAIALLMPWNKPGEQWGIENEAAYLDRHGGPVAADAPGNGKPTRFVMLAAEIAAEIAQAERIVTPGMQRFADMVDG